MAKKPVGRPRRAPREPNNRSSAAGSPAPVSRAASAPMEGAFYQVPGDRPESPLSQSEATEPVQRAQLRETFTSATRSGAMPLERGGSVDREVAEHMAADTISDADALEAEIERIRKIRKPLGEYSQKLALPTRRGYHRHWFNDVAGRVDEAEANGWSHILGKDGKPIQRCVGTGRDKGALYAYAMELPEVFWLEDQATRNRMASDKMAALKSNPFQAKPGMAKPSDTGKFYSPTEALTIEKGV